MNPDATDRPWRNRLELEKLGRSWGRLVGLPVTRVTGGPGWMGVTLGEDPRNFLWFVCLPGLAAAWDSMELPDRTIRSALGWRKSPPTAAHLRGCRLAGVTLLPDDRVLHLDFQRDEDGGRVVLLHQLFGARGGLTLLDKKGRLLWSLFASPHPVLTTLPPDPPADDAPQTDPCFRDPALTAVTALLSVQQSSHLEGVLRRRLKSTRRLCRQLETDLENADRGDYWRLVGETLAIHMHTLRRGMDHVELPTAAGDQILEIDLDPARTPADNLDRCFHRARKAQRGRAIIAERLLDAQTKLARFEELNLDLQAATGVDEDLDRLAALLQWRTDHSTELGLDPKPDKLRKPADREPGRPFRRYLIDGKWEAWVGRDSRENDLLTHRSSALTDLWFHAQGVSGSHVILRSSVHGQPPPRSVLAKAAALAALHSKARNSGLVPVIYTPRRYVRKPRKAPPGTAVCLQEKCLMVEPGLAGGVETA